jgi:hypothetical protein
MQIFMKITYPAGATPSEARQGDAKSSSLDTLIDLIQNLSPADRATLIKRLMHSEL